MGLVELTHSMRMPIRDTFVTKGNSFAKRKDAREGRTWPCLQKRFDRLRCSGSQKEGGLRLRRLTACLKDLKRLPAHRVEKRIVGARPSRQSVKLVSVHCSAVLFASQRKSEHPINEHTRTERHMSSEAVHPIDQGRWSRASGHELPARSLVRLSPDSSEWQSLWALLRAEAHCRLIQAHMYRPLSHSFRIGSRARR
jgi:hypothetical protein